MTQRPRIRRPCTRHQRGMALLTVVWMLVILSALVIGLGVTARTETYLARNQVDTARARYLAEAGIQRAILALLDESEAARLRPDGSSGIEFQLAGGVVRATVQDECGKIDLNTGWGELVRGAVQVAGGSTGRDSDAVVDAILDWRDPDDQRNQRGAERREYEAAGRVGPRNAAFQTVEELQQVLGVTPDLYRRIEPLVTVSCLQSGIDPRVAPLGALRALPGIRDREVEQVAVARKRTLDRGDALPDATLSGIARYTSKSPGYAYTVRAVATLTGGAVFRLDALVWLTPDGERPYALLGLREARPGPGS
jgi:general secretion pathway protein K